MSFADGQLPVTKGSLLTVKNSKGVVVSNIMFYNNNAVTQTIKVYVKRKGSVSRGVWTSSLAQDGFASVINGGDHAWDLAAEDEIEGETTTAAAVDYTILGVEKV